MVDFRHTLISLVLLSILTINVNAQEKIVFSRSVGGINTGGTLDIMSYDLATNKTSLLLKGTVSRRGEYNSAISPNNSKIVFNTYRFSGWKLGIADYKDGKIDNVARLTDRPNYEYNAVFSPDGTKIAYQEYNWSTRDTDIFIADQDGKNAVQFTTSKGADSTPDWAKDNKQIVFMSARSGDLDIYIKSIDGKSINNLTQNEAIDFAPSTSKTEDKIAFLSDREGRVNLYVMDLNGENLINLNVNLKTDVMTAKDFDEAHYWAYKTSWSPAGDNIVFTAMLDGNLEIFTINKDGSNLTQITDNNDTDMTPFWTGQ